MTKVAVFGSGKVGDALADGFLGLGDSVRRATRDLQKLEAWRARAAGDASIGTYADAAAWADVVVLAVKGTAAEAVVDGVAAQLAGKVVIDTTNPIADAPPDGGCLRYFTGANESLMERLQAKAPQAKLVKAFNSVGAPFMVNPAFATRPAMFLCGDDAGAKQQVAAVIERFGWQPVDVGGATVARPVEALCQLWCAPGFLRNDWAHAFAWLTP